MESKKKALIAASIAGILAIAPAFIGGIAHAENVPCYGVNKCKGAGDCGGKGNSCAGKNTCKGAGLVMMDAGTCDKVGGSLKA